MKKMQTVTKTGKIQSSQGNYYLNISYFPYGCKLYCKKIQSFLYVTTVEPNDYDYILRTVLNTAKAHVCQNILIDTSLKVTQVMDYMNWHEGDFIQGTQISEMEFSFSLASEYEKKYSQSGKLVNAKEKPIGTVRKTGHPSYPVFNVKLPQFEILNNEQMVLLVQTEKENYVRITYKVINKEIAQTFPYIGSKYNGRSLEECSTFRLGIHPTLPKHLVRFFNLSVGQTLPILEQTSDSITFGLGYQRDIITNELCHTGVTKMQKIAVSKESAILLQPIQDACLANENQDLNQVLEDMKKECQKKIKKAKSSIAKCEKLMKEMNEV